MDEPISKSQKKRDADALQKTGVELAKLPESILNALNLPQPLFQALIEAKRLKSHGAMRRQAQLIGKIMRHVDYESIVQRYEAIKADQAASTASFHEIETWRTRLIEEGKPALTDFIESYPEVNRQALRQLIKKAVEDKARFQASAVTPNSPLSSGSSKALFRFLREVIL